MADVLDDLLNNKSEPAPEEGTVSGGLMTNKPPTDELQTEAMDVFRRAQDMTYKDPGYDDKVSDLLAGVEGAEYKSEYETDIDDLIGTLQGAEFSYDPTTDEAFQQAQKVSQRQVFEEMGARGILPSTVTSDRLADVVAEQTGEFRDRAYNEFRGTQQDRFNLLNSLTQLDQLAYTKFQDKLGTDLSLAGYYNNLANQDYGRFVDEVNNLYKQADFISSMDAQQRLNYQNQLDNEYRQNYFEYEKAQAEITNARNQILDAWERTSQLGYVDNDAAMILGVEPGTESQRAREIRQAYENELSLMERELANRISEIQFRSAQDMALLEAEKAMTDASDPTMIYQNASPAQQRAYTAAKQHFAETLNSEGYDAAVKEFQKRGELYQQAMGAELSNIFETEVQGVAQAGYESSVMQGLGVTDTTPTAMSDYQSVFETANKYMYGQWSDPQMAESIIQSSNLQPSEKQQMMSQLNLEGQTNQTNDVNWAATGSWTEDQAYTEADSMADRGMSDAQIDQALRAKGWMISPDGLIVPVGE